MKSLREGLGITTEAHRQSGSLGWTAQRQRPSTIRNRFLGCLLGGAIGDALGAPVEFLRRPVIRSYFGDSGIQDFATAYGGVGIVTDDTQMTLFTAEGLLRGWVRGSHKGITDYVSCIGHAYLRWLTTQGRNPRLYIETKRGSAGWLYGQNALHYQRAPGDTCIGALEDMTAFAQPAENDSKGCGGVMRVAPVGLFCARLSPTVTPKDAFELGLNAAALTHGHPSGVLPAGVLAVLVMALAEGVSLRDGLATAKQLLVQHSAYGETLQSIELAEQLVNSRKPPATAIQELGEGWVAEEALSISLYCALTATTFREGVITAVNHDGDSDSTGAITGHLLGAQWGITRVPKRWREHVELSDVIKEVADDLFEFRNWDIGEFSTNPKFDRAIWTKYPGD